MWSSGTSAASSATSRVLDNRATTAADFTQYSITAPSDPRLPDGGGYVVGGLYDLNPNKVGQVDNLFTFASNFGKQIEHWNGVDLTINARPRGGVVLQGGVSTGRTTTDSCEVREKVPEMVLQPAGYQFPLINPTNPYCHVDTNFLTQIKLLGTYTIPKVAVQFGATFQSVPGPVIAGHYIVLSSAEAARTLGRPLSGGAPNVSVNLIPTGQVLCATGEPARCAPREDPPLRKSARIIEPRHTQHAEPQRHPAAERQLRGVADAADDHGGSPLQDQHECRLLARFTTCSGGSRTQSEVAA